MLPARQKGWYRTVSSLGFASPGARMSQPWSRLILRGSVLFVRPSKSEVFLRSVLSVTTTGPLEELCIPNCCATCATSPNIRKGPGAARWPPQKQGQAGRATGIAALHVPHTLLAQIHKETCCAACATQCLIRETGKQACGNLHMM